MMPGPLCRKKIIGVTILALSLVLLACQLLAPPAPPTEVSLESRVGPVQVSRSTLPAGETADLRVDVVKVVGDSNPFRFLWTSTGGQIVNGQGSCCATYQAPDQPGSYTVSLVVTYGSQLVQRSVTLAVVAPTPLVTPTATPTSGPPTATPAPTEVPLADAKAYFERAADYYLRRDFERTIADYTKAIELNYDPLSDPYYQRGYVYYVQQNYRSAVADFSKAIELNYDPASQVYYDRANANYYLGQYDQAIADYGKAIELKYEPLSRPYNNRGLAHRKKAAYEQAIADYTKAIELKHEPLNWPFYNRGNIYADQGQYAKAIADYTEAIRLDATDVAAYYARGLAYKKSGNTGQATADFKKVLELDQGSLRGEAEQQLQELGSQ
jgi:tetratricopeptide (TPR) repeat protein